MKRLLILAALFLLLFSILPACSGDGEDRVSPTDIVAGTQTKIPTATATSTITPTPNSKVEGPVKIGAITAWSGPMAVAGTSIADPVVKLVEWQVKQQGGVLGGREVKVVKYDNRASVAEAVAGCNKLVYEDKVSALVWGGVSGAEQEGMSDFAEEHHILYVQFGGVSNAEEKKYTLSGSSTRTATADGIVDLLTKELKPKTVAILSSNLADSQERAEVYKKGITETGASLVYEQYTEQSTSDFSPYLTKVKYNDPDLLIIDFGPPEPYITIAKQIMELGGWGNIKVVGIVGAAQSVKQAGAQGWYVSLAWTPGQSYPGAVKFEQEYQQVNGKTPTANSVLYYNPLWTAIHAITTAGTDTDLEEIAWTARFSGKVEWETPMGCAHYTAESQGHPGLPAIIVQIVNKEIILVTIPE